MNINYLKVLSFDELCALYRNFLHNQNISQRTVKTAYADTFYLWRHGNRDLFWNTVTAVDFETEAKMALIKAFSKHPVGNVASNLNGYLSHLRRFRAFLASEGTAFPVAPKMERKTDHVYPRKKKAGIDVPMPSVDQVQLYLERWMTLENYRLQ